jgi:hypothetical protein
MIVHSRFGATPMTKGYSPIQFDSERVRQETTKRLMRLGLISLAVGIGVLVLIGFLFPLTSYLPNHVGDAEPPLLINWTLLEGIASAVTLALIIGGLAFAFVEYTENEVQQKRQTAESAFSIYKEVFDRLMNPSEAEARRWIILNLPTLKEMGGDQQAWQAVVKDRLESTEPGIRAPGKDYLKQVLNTFDFIGFVAKHYWNMENELVEWMSPVIAKVWERVSGYVEQEAKDRNEPDYYASAREFGDHCLEWRRKNYPDSTIIDNAT